VDKEFYSKKKKLLIEDINKIKLNIKKGSEQVDAFAGRRGSGWAQNISRNSAIKQVRKSKRTYSINDINTNSRNLSGNANTTSHFGNNYSSLAEKNISPYRSGLNRPQEQTGSHHPKDLSTHKLSKLIPLINSKASMPKDSDGPDAYLKKLESENGLKFQAYRDTILTKKQTKFLSINAGSLLESPKVDGPQNFPILGAQRKRLDNSKRNSKSYD
jgi:hypothetical protein